MVDGIAAEDHDETGRWAAEVCHAVGRAPLWRTMAEEGLKAGLRALTLQRAQRVGRPAVGFLSEAQPGREAGTRWGKLTRKGTGEKGRNLAWRGVTLSCGDTKLWDWSCPMSGPSQ